MEDLRLAWADHLFGSGQSFYVTDTISAQEVTSHERARAGDFNAASRTPPWLASGWGCRTLKMKPTSQAVEIEAALALAMAGDAARAESVAQDLGRRFPLDTQIQSIWLPTIQAQLMLDRKNPAGALNRLQAASSIESGASVF